MVSCVTEVQLRELEWKTKTRGLVRGTVMFIEDILMCATADPIDAALITLIQEVPACVIKHPI